MEKRPPKRVMTHCQGQRCSASAFAVYFFPGDLVPGFVLAIAAAVSVFGRPVLSSGTAFNASRKALSDIPANTFSPARSNSLFLAGCASAAARCLSVSMTAYSSLGIVKLSRTSFGFLGFVIFSTLGGATAVVFAFWVGARFNETTSGATGVFFATAFVGALLAGVARTGVAFVGVADFAATGAAIAPGAGVAVGACALWAVVMGLIS